MIKTIFPLIAVSLLMLSCGQVKTSSHFTAPSNNIKTYKALEITDFITDIEKLPKEMTTALPGAIEKKLNEHPTHFKEVKHGNVTSVLPRETLVLLGEIKEFKSGSDIRIEGGAIKFGEFYIYISLAVVEKDTGNEITTGEVVGFSSMSFSKGEKSFDLIADEVLKFIVKNS